MSVIFAGGDFTRFEPWQDIESTDNINAAAQERRGFPFQGKELAVARNNTQSPLQIGWVPNT